MNLTDFHPGDVLYMTERTRAGDEVRAAQVQFVNFNNLGGITFIGYRSANMLPTGSGWFDPTAVGTKPFGLIEVRIVGRAALPMQNFRGPRPGDRTYDSMC